MIYNTCPVCSSEAEFHILSKGTNTVAFIYNCDTHGLFGVSENFDAQLRYLNSSQNSSDTFLIHQFGEKLMQRVHSREMAEIPMFERLPS